MEHTLVSHRGCRSAARAMVLLAALGVAFASPAAAAIFQVSNTNDSGPGSLRQAIQDANASLGDDRIVFSIPASGVQTIRPLSQLPNFWEKVSIDGSTQGPTNQHLIVIDGSADPSGWGLMFRAPGSVIRHLVVNGFSRTGVGLYGDGYLLSDCLIGTDASGEVEVGNGTGVWVSGSGNWIVSNTISGNGHGLWLNGSFNLVEHNLLGPDKHGRPFAASGTVSQWSSLVVEKTGNEVRFNTIGATYYTVYLFYARRSQIVGNSIGLASDGATPLGFPAFGVFVDHSSDSLISGNRMGHIGWGWGVLYQHPCAGVAVVDGTRNTVRENTVYDLHWSAPLAIDLGVFGPDANDPGDSDKGPNDLQNSPVILDALSHSTGTQIEGELGSTPGTLFTLDFYATTAASAPGACEARVHLGAVVVTSDASGYAPFSLALRSRLDAGTQISATATATPGGVLRSTSESSPCVAVHN